MSAELCLAILVVILMGPARATADSWAPLIVDGASGAGTDLQLRNDSAGQPHVAYWTPSAAPIRLATFDGANWLLEDVPLGAPLVPAATSSARGATPASAQLLITYAVRLALDAGDRPWLATVRHDCFGDCTGPVRVTHRDAGPWITETIETAYGNHGITVSPGGTVTVVYRRTAGVRAARRTGGGWSYEDVASAGDVAEVCTGPDGEPQVLLTFAAAPPSGLRILRRSAGQWDARIVAAPAGDLAAATFALAENGLARLAITIFSADHTQRFLWLVREQADGSWVPEPIPAAGSNVNSPALALGSYGDERIAFQDIGTQRARLARLTPSGWLAEDVDATPMNKIDTGVDGLGRTWVVFGAGGFGLRSARAIAVADAPPAVRTTALALRVTGGNPVHAGTDLDLTLDCPRPDVVRIEMFDVLGRTVGARGPMAVPAGETHTQLNVSAPAGLVLVRARTEHSGTALARAILLR
jgi:hypothetical protein